MTIQKHSLVCTAFVAGVLIAWLLEKPTTDNFDAQFVKKRSSYPKEILSKFSHRLCTSIDYSSSLSLKTPRSTRRHVANATMKNKRTLFASNVKVSCVQLVQMTTSNTHHAEVIVSCPFAISSHRMYKTFSDGQEYARRNRTRTACSNFTVMSAAQLYVNYVKRHTETTNTI